MDTDAYLRSVRPVLVAAFAGETTNDNTERIVDRITDDVRDLLGLDALLELVQANAQVARRIMEDVRDMIQLDYINEVRSARSLQRTVQLIEDDPWNNDERVALVGFLQILELIGLTPEQSVPQMNPGLFVSIPAILMSRMAAHRSNKFIQHFGILALYQLASGLKEGGDRFLPHLVAMAPGAYDSVVAAMMLHEQSENIQKYSVILIFRLIGALNRGVNNAAEIATRFVRAPGG